MKFFNIDLHISVIEDIKTIFNDLGHQVDSKCLSYHAWVLGRSTDKVDIISQSNWTNICPKMCDDFYERYKDELSEYDGFIVTHTPCFALLYEKFNKPIITIASTRYEAPFTHNWQHWEKFNNFLVNKIDEEIILPISNNLFDKSYCEHFTKREWQYIPSLCEYTNLKYTGTKEEFVSYSKSLNLPNKNLISKENIKDKSWKNLYSHKGIVHVPYNISTMSIFEQKTAGVPLLFPSIDYLLEIPNNLSELFYGGMSKDPHGTTCEIWRDKQKVKLADFYQWKEVLYFDNVEHLSQLMNIVDFEKMSERSLRENQIIKKEVYKKWSDTLSKLKTPHNKNKSIYEIKTNSKYISFITPSRKRPEALIESAKSLYNTADDINSFEMLIGFDNDDVESANKFLEYSCNNLKGLNFKLKFFENKGYQKLHEYTNSLCGMSEGDWLWLWNDDCKLEQKGWDTQLKKHEEDFKLIKIKSKQEPSFPLALFPIIPKKWFDLIGYFSLHPHNDIWLGNVAKNLDLIKEDNSFFIDHYRLPNEKGEDRTTEYVAHTLYEDEYYKDNIKKSIEILAKHLKMDKLTDNITLV